jgi:hypothetical protein
MRTIQTYLPNPRHAEIHRIFVNAKPDVAWDAARHFDMSEVPWVKLLFDIRTLPNKLTGKAKGEGTPGLGVDAITRSETGFMILEEIPGQVVVVGSVGQYWHLNIPFTKVSKEEFKDFNQPGHGKIAWAIAVEPYLYGSTISLELRTTATDEESWRKLNRYYHVIGMGSYLIRSSVMAHFAAELGKMKLPDDDDRSLPGDELLPHCKYSLTAHRNIEAPVSMVWRYLMQLGCERAGWYSIDWLDNGGKASIDHVVAGWETRKAGDRIAATPSREFFFDTLAVEPEKYFIVGDGTELLGSPFKMTWSFVLEPIGEDATHLVNRARMESSPPWKEWLLGKVFYPPIHGLMQATQLNNIKGMAERDAKARVVTNQTVLNEIS